MAGKFHRATVIVSTLMLVFSLTGSVFAMDEFHEIVYVADSEVKSEMEVNNVTGEPVSISIDKEIVDEISGDDIEVILTKGLGTTENEIEIVSQDTLKKNGIDTMNPDGFYVFNENEELVGVTVSDEISKEDTSVIADIISDTPKDGDIVNIEDVVAFEQPDEPDNPPEVVEMINETENSHNSCHEPFNEDLLENDGEGDVSAEGLTYYIENGKKTESGSEYNSKDKFITSVAKGETVYLSSEFKASVSCTLEAGGCFDVAQAKAGMTSSVTCTIAKKTKFSSENMKKGKNSREFRVRFYKQKYTRKQYKKRRVTHKLLGTKEAIFAVPTRYARYSIDKKI